VLCGSFCFRPPALFVFGRLRFWVSAACAFGFRLPALLGFGCRRFWVSGAGAFGFRPSFSGATWRLRFRYQAPALENPRGIIGGPQNEPAFEFDPEPWPTSRRGGFAMTRKGWHFRTTSERLAIWHLALRTLSRKHQQVSP
tara:strand:- start:238069 stop:238491 length:423 start_codon:yes stop_codon:yes gene_type:complete